LRFHAKSSLVPLWANWMQSTNSHQIIIDTFDIILRFQPSSLNWSLRLKFSDHNFVIISHVCYIFCTSHCLDLIVRIIGLFSEEYWLWRSLCNSLLRTVTCSGNTESPSTTKQMHIINFDILKIAIDIGVQNINGCTDWQYYCPYVTKFHCRLHSLWN
jgi:hypothetical protein